MTPVDPAELNKWLAWMNLAFGATLLVFGLRNRGSFGEILAPTGALALLGATIHFLSGSVPDSVLIALMIAGFGGCSVWWVRLYRLSRARLRDLRNRRAGTGDTTP